MRYRQECAIMLFAAMISACIVPGFRSPAGAAPPDSRIVIRNDRGGSVPERIALIETLRRQNSRVEIRGAECLSACTMHLGLPGVCVVRRTSFGFHGRRITVPHCVPASSSTGRAALPTTIPSPCAAGTCGPAGPGLPDISG
ncbi:hypothetical protein [Mangrovicoccus sp. HB161399]|uniref:hypothetical protein n=1 Tax=Mangrovicoccus sp. HB161399 TaxID=2720392 RepID=UPI001552FD80|nr:hypothetical protein [Mangrovicoccus sp. HB161399]